MRLFAKSANDSASKSCAALKLAVSGILCGTYCFAWEMPPKSRQNSKYSVKSYECEVLCKNSTKEYTGLSSGGLRREEDVAAAAAAWASEVVK